MRILLLLFCSVLVAACEGGSEDSATSARIDAAESPVERTEINFKPSNSYQEAHAAAVAAIRAASEKGSVWSSSDQLLEKAAKAVASGDEAQAIAFADEARIHAELAKIQADREATAWRDNVIAE